MALTKQVNGVRVDMTVEEEADIRAEWAENDTLKAQDEAANGWIRARIAAYKTAFSVEDQLDIMYDQMEHMISNGEMTAAPSMRIWLDTIAQIKTDNPKPTE